MRKTCKASSRSFHSELTAKTHVAKLIEPNTLFCRIKN